MYKFIGTRRNKNLIAYYNKYTNRWVNQDYLFSITLKGTEAEFFDDFYKEAETGSPTTDWGRERKVSNREDIMNKGDRMMLDAMTENMVELPGNGYEAAIIAKIDSDRGRYEQDDIRPGLYRDSDGRYQCAKFVPELGKSIRASYDTLEDAERWHSYYTKLYSKAVR